MNKIEIQEFKGRKAREDIADFINDYGMDKERIVQITESRNWFFRLTVTLYYIENISQDEECSDGLPQEEDFALSGESKK